MVNENNEKLITVREAAKECGRNMETVRRWIWSGKLPAEKLGNQLFIKREDLASYCRLPARSVPAKALREKIHARTGKTFDAGEEIRQMREELMNEIELRAPKEETSIMPGSRAGLIKRMRELREEIRARVGNLDAVETIEQLRQERMNGLTHLR